MLDDSGATAPQLPSPGEPRQSMAERYGASSVPRRRTAIGAVVVLAAVSLAWLVWAAWVHATPAVSAELHSYDVVSPHEVAVVIDVRRQSPDEVQCLVRALAEDHSTVGEQVVHVPAGQVGDVRFEATVRTDREATTALVSDCR